MTEAGTLGTFISDADKYTITELTVSGPLNGSDLRLIRDMAGSDHNRQPTGGKLSILDLRDAFFVSGGSWYIESFSGLEYTIHSSNLPDYAFAWCPSLESVTLPKSLYELQYWSLHWCKNLNEVVFPVGVTKINSNNLNYSDNLTTVHLPSTIETIEDGCFYSATNLTNIYCLATEPPTLNTEFHNTNISNGTLYVPKGCSDKYWRAEGWSSFGNIKELDHVWYEMQIRVLTGGSVKYNDYLIAPVEYDGLTFNEIEAFDVIEGGSVTLFIIPDDGYVVSHVSINNNDVTNSIVNNVLTIENINEVKHVRVRFTDASSAVNETFAQHDVQVNTRDGEIIVNGVKNGDKVNVFNISGGMVASVRSVGQECRIKLPKGMYIVSAGGSSFKVLM